MSGLSILLRKELLESWRTMRLPVVGGLFLVVGLTSPLLAKFLPEIIKAAAGDQLGTIAIPTPVAADALAQLWKNLGQFGAFAAIILAMGAVATEQDRGTAAFVLSKSVTRRAFLVAKVVSIGLVLAVAVALAVIVGWVYTAILFEPPSILGWIVTGLLAWLALAVWGAVTFLGSAMTGSTAAAAGIGFGGWLVLSLVAAIPNLARFLPGGLAAPALAAGAGTSTDGGDLVVPVVSCAILIVAALALAGRSFGRQEL
jgi:ABC-2 type transport system permease protein